jgi:dipeptidyl aminopeptidase/acylaminoacyl peptidase
MVLLPLAVAANTGPRGAERLYFRRDGRVMTAELARGRERTLWPEPDADEVEAPAVSRDGATVFFSQDGNLWAIGSEGGLPRRLTRLGRPRPAAERCDSPWPSPDGGRLAYRCTAAGGRSELRLLTLADGSDRGLAEDIEGQAAWAPDGRSLVFTAGGRLWRLALDRPGRPQSVAPSAAGADRDPFFGDDGRLWFSRAGLAMVQAPGSAPAPATPRPVDGGQPRLSPDGDRLALVRTAVDPSDPRHAWSEISVVRLGLAGVQRVVSTYAPQGVNGHAQLLGWLDGERLLVLRDLNEMARKVYAVGVDAPAAQLLFKGQDRDDGFTVWPS